MNEAIALFTMVVEAAIPFAITWAIGERIVVSFLSMALKGEVKF